METGPLFRVETKVGRLVEARIFGLSTTDDVAAYAREFGPALWANIRGPVLCADHRPVRIYSQPVADELVSLFNAMNERWVRVAILAARSNATFALQLQRIVRESGNPSRRVFFEAEEAARFLGEVLTPVETRRARLFLDTDG